MNQDQALNQEETEEDLFMPELMDNMEEGENNELISLSASELINTTDGEKFGLEGPSGSVLEHIMVDCDDFYLLEEKRQIFIRFRKHQDGKSTNEWSE
jgi:hypothetical protein